MIKEISELQKRRADNIIWNGAGDYSFTPDLKVYDSAGQAELYWNMIIGAAHRHYDYSRIESMLYGLRDYEDSDLYEGLAWLSLESALFGKEKETRPVMASLRKEYAQSYLQLFSHPSAGLSAWDPFHLLADISCAYWRKVLEKESYAEQQISRLSEYDTALLGDLFLPADLSTEETVQRIELLLKKWFQVVTERKKAFRKPFRFPGVKKLVVQKKKGKSSEKYIRFGRGIAYHPENVYGGSSASDNEKYDLSTKLSANELREFMEAKFGQSVLSPNKTAELERSLCRGSHEACHILVTDGIRNREIHVRNGFEALSRQRETAQIERNREFYEANRARNSLAISRLAANIRNSVLLHLQPSPVKSDYDTLNAPVVWRGPVLNDRRVFSRQENENMGDLCVDILLDASTSQTSRQEIISSQGYIIAESLTRCGIPCRVMSFCSMTGYTIVRFFRDYHRPGENRKIFDYVSNGCNRDGLAIRTAAHFISQSPYEHRILIVLSDVKPNDIVKIYRNGSEEGTEYDAQAGLEDTALEVRRARADGISVICIFTGEDEDLPSAKLVYGRDFVRIRSFDVLADTVGMLIRNQIRSL